MFLCFRARRYFQVLSGVTYLKVPYRITIGNLHSVKRETMHTIFLIRAKEFYKIMKKIQSETVYLFIYKKTEIKVLEDCPF
jgi:hypothetical protein